MPRRVSAALWDGLAAAAISKEGDSDRLGSRVQAFNNKMTLVESVESAVVFLDSETFTCQFLRA